MSEAVRGRHNGDSHWSKVVFPEPRNPVSRVTGIFLSSSSDIVGDCGWGLVGRVERILHMFHFSTF